LGPYLKGIKGILISSTQRFRLLKLALHCEYDKNYVR
jgi:hypothetical protein